MNNQILKHSILIVFINIFLWSTFPLYSSTYRDTVALDPSIRQGVLPNGLTYYIKPTRDSSSKIDIRLVVKAGTALLDPDQYELQHVLEHVAFKAGKHMTMAKANSLGFKLGQINGSTSFDFTKYCLKFINTKTKRDIAFQLLQDIIWNLELKEEYIDSERSIIINELALRGRFRASSILNGLENSMIGRTPKLPRDIVKHIKTFPYEPLIRYYNDWYRPDLMALVVVGDIKDMDKMEREINEKFSRDKPVKNPRPAITDYSNYRSLPPQFIRQEHPYLTKDSRKKTVYFRLYMRQKEEWEENGIEALKNEQQRQLLVNMLGDRLKEKQESYNTNFNAFPKFRLPSTLDLQLNITIEDGSEKEILLKTMQTLRQLQTDGFSTEEFIESKKKYLVSLSKTDTTTVSYWTDNIRDHFVYGKVLPQNKKALLKEMMTNLNLEEYNRFIKDYLKTSSDDIDIIILAPPGHRMLSYSEKTIRDWIAEVNTLPVAPYNKPKVPSNLINPVTINNLKESTVQRKAFPLPETTEYLLGNGVRVVLNSFDSTSIQSAKQRHRLSFHGFTNKGIGCYSPEDYFSALNSVDIVKNSGIGDLNKFELKRFFTHKGFNGQITPYINYEEAGIRGSVSLKDLEIALQLVYLYFTMPNKDSQAFEDWKLNASSSYALYKINQKDFKTTIKSVLRDSLFIPKGSKFLEGVSKTDMERAYKIYKEIYGSAEDFTFIFTGDFPNDKVLSLCRKYLGNLPAGQNLPKCQKPITSKQYSLPKPRSMTIPSTEYMQEVKVQLVYTSKLDAKDLDWKEEAKSRLLHRLMKFSIMQEMRYNSKEGGTYTIGVGLNLERPRLFNEVFIRFGCSPDNLDRLIMEAKRFVTSFKNSTVDVGLLKEYIKGYVLSLEKEKNSRKHISDKIYDYYKFGRPWHGINEEQEYIKSISPLDIKNTAQKLLREKPFEFKLISSQEL